MKTLLAATTFATASLASLITSLPGQPAVSFEQYSGYVPVSENKQLFYWLQMSDSRQDPSQIPLFFWTNGGPGCSGMLAALTEQGAFRIKGDGSLQLNPGRWNQLAHMVFMEQPAGVGFSFSTNPKKDYQTGDIQSVKDMYVFINEFLELYPNLARNPIYISSESYGGHYMPQLAKYIVDHNRYGALNFKGFAVGNPYTDPVENAKGMYETFFGRQLVSLPLWQKWEMVCNGGANYNTAKCQNVMYEMESAIGDIYLYGVDYPVCHESRRMKRHMAERILKPLGRGKGFKTLFSEKEVGGGNQGLGDDDLFDPCASEYEWDYLNRADVQRALHVKGNVQWEMCSDAVWYGWNESDSTTFQEHYYNYLIDGGYDLHILVFSGDNDAVCGTLGTQSWIWNLGYEVQTPWTAWTMREDTGEQVAGYLVKFVRGNGQRAFTFATVHTSGHEVPWYKPMRGFEVLKRYLSDEW